MKLTTELCVAKICEYFSCSASKTNLEEKLDAKAWKRVSKTGNAKHGFVRVFLNTKMDALCMKANATITEQLKWVVVIKSTETEITDISQAALYNGKLLYTDKEVNDACDEIQGFVIEKIEDGTMVMVMGPGKGPYVVGGALVPARPAAVEPEKEEKRISPVKGKTFYTLHIYEGEYEITFYGPKGERVIVSELGLDPALFKFPKKKDADVEYIGDGLAASIEALLNARGIFYTERPYDDVMKARKPAKPFDAKKWVWMKGEDDAIEIALKSYWEREHCLDDRGIAGGRTTAEREGFPEEFDEASESSFDWDGKGGNAAGIKWLKEHGVEEVEF